MKIHLDNVNLRSSTGPNTFAQRICKYFINNGHEVTLDGKSADISLVFIQPSGNQLAKKVVQRLDGIWFKPDEFETKNADIKLLYKHADGVIWQSEFDRTMTSYHWDSPASGVVIKNGIEVHKRQIQNATLKELRLRHEKLFVCSANWHPQKRLTDNVRLFRHIKENFHSTAGLIILGTNPIIDLQSVPSDIYYPGSLSHEQCLEVFAACDWMIHLAWLDHCPNTVVEAMSQGVPVICSSTGGTKELVGGYGLVIQENEYSFQPINYDNPPSVNFSSVNKLPEFSELNCNFDVSIETCGDQYLKFFDRILKQ
jgi:glycosyltransferase involved in cell wall biosynthesis